LAVLKSSNQNHLLLKIGLPTTQINTQLSAIRQSHYLELRPQGLNGEISQKIEAATMGMNTRWYSLSLTSPLVGSSIADANIRTLTGATIVAIRRADGTQLDYPTGETSFGIDDRTLVIGSNEEQIAFEQLIKGEFAIQI
jgi:monovalent cation:H+ antiporter-2, CPA2 family